MFVQVIEGRTKDPEGIKRQGDRWQAEVRPGAVGYLGVTSGSTADGRTIAIVRFESEEAARANSERAEQTAWFEEMKKYYEGEISFTESSDTTEFMGGGSNEAGFVQVMKSSGLDRAQVERMDALFEKVAPQRPEILGLFRVWTGADSCIDVAYFTNEDDARSGEKQPVPPELQEAMAEFGDMTRNTEFLDLSDPQIH